MRGRPSAPSSHRRATARSYCEPRPMTPSIAAVVTPAPPQAVGSDGWNVSAPTADCPASRVVAIVFDVGCPGCGLMAGSVTLATTLPLRWTAAAAPVVENCTTVWVPSLHVTMAVPFVVLLAQLPLPVGTGSWKRSPVAGSVTTLPASTAPEAGAPA